MNELLNQRYSDRRPDRNLPFWKRQESNPQTLAAQQAQGNERRQLFESLLGADAKPYALIDPTDRERRYGSLSDDKLDAAAKIERDYEEVSGQAMAARHSNLVTGWDNVLQQQQMLETEKLKDLAGVLSPDELAQYEMRNSRSASALMNKLRNVDVTGEEYAALYQAQKSSDATPFPLGPAMTQDTVAQWRAAQQALHDQFQQVLGEDRFYKYMEGSDAGYAMVTQFAAGYPQITPAVSYKVYQLQNELQNALMQFSRNRSSGTASPPDVAGYNARLDSLLGPEAAAAYRKQRQGSIFALPANPGGK
ncbi:MAG: hypothetical protein ACHQ5A_09645 [Opitutales bacterium]